MRTYFQPFPFSQPEPVKVLETGLTIDIGGVMGSVVLPAARIRFKSGREQKVVTKALRER